MYNELYDYNKDGKLDSNEYYDWDTDTFGGGTSGAGGACHRIDRGSAISFGSIILAAIVWLIYAAFFVIGFLGLLLCPPVGAIFIVIAYAIRDNL